MGPIIGYFDEYKKPGLLHSLWVRFVVSFFNDKMALVGVVSSAHQLGISEQTIRTVPNAVCLIVGTKDPFLKSAQALIDKIVDLQIVTIEGANHITTPSRTETKQALLDFLDEHSLKN